MTTTDTHLLLRAFVDELARCGLHHAATSPGSRSTPLVLTLAADPRIRCWSHIDERSGGFFAVGLAKATGLPVALACTSGTAAAELSPAVHEAHEGRVPLLVLTADRPPELRETGAGQTIDQIKLYGGAVKWFFEVGTHDASPTRLRWIRTLACRAYWTALQGRPGPVHLNFPLREPLVLDEPLPPDESGREGDRPWVTRPRAVARFDPPVLGQIESEVRTRPRGVVVLGMAENDPLLPGAAARFAEAAGYPLLADPLSRARRGPAAVAHYDALLRDAGFATEHSPDFIIRAGDLPTSKPLRQWLADSGDALQLGFDAAGSWQDPDGVLGTLLQGDPAATLEDLAARLAVPGGGTWLASWRAADRRAAGAIAAVLGPDLSEPRIAAELGVGLPEYVTLLVASSMPVRDIETFFPVRDDPPRVLGLRGANGIDGTVSAAFGAAAAAVGPVVVLIGDVALAHDVGGLLAATRHGLKLTIVLLDNDGGGIFNFLPVAGAGDAFEEQVATPHGLDFARAAALYGCGHQHVEEPPAFREAMNAALGAERTAIVEVRTDREENVAVHRRVWEAVAEALEPGP